MTREEAIKTIRELKRETNDSWYEEVYDMAIEALSDVPDINVGKWINCKYPLGECSKCHAIVDIQNNEANYCPVCGSKNRGEEDGCN